MKTTSNTRPHDTIVDAIRHVTAIVQNAIDSGERSRMMDADDLVEVLLAIAERIEAADDNKT